MNVIQIQPTKSALRNLLIQIVADSASSWDVISNAGELISVDVLFDKWFLYSAKGKLPEEELMDALEAGEDLSLKLEAAWNNRHLPGGMDLVRDVMRSGIERLRSIMERR
jgi:hypothetical protein